MPTSTIVLELGGHHVELGGPPATIIVQPITVEFTPDQVFTAANRIESLQDDLAQFSQNWQQDLRIALDDRGAPSMSVGDRYRLISAAGKVMIDVICQPRGWKYEFPS